MLKTTLQKTVQSLSAAELAASAHTTPGAQAHLSVEQRVRAIGRQIQKDYGVVVVPKRGKASNPYDMTAEEAIQIMQKAGILTKAGQLSTSYK
nr:hypothetical protein [uncultured Albidiferax sp.]